MDETLLFTPAALLSLLSQVEELKEVDIGVTETIDGDIQVDIGESTYIINSDDAIQVTVNDAVADAVEDANISAYEDLADSGEVVFKDGDDMIQSGIIKELAKTLLVGGVVRLTTKLLK